MKAKDQPHVTESNWGEASTHHPCGCVCVCWGYLSEGHVGSAPCQCFTSNSHFKKNLQTAEQPGRSTLVWDAGEQMLISQRASFNIFIKKKISPLKDIN